MNEKQITTKIIAYLKSEGFFVWKQHGSAFQQSGLPDVFAVKGGKLFGFEVKRPGGVVSKLQQKRIADLQKAGALVCVVRSVEEVAQFIASLPSRPQ
jgi:Holliday junction resolvase